jgi:hypothetical protein
MPDKALPCLETLQLMVDDEQPRTLVWADGSMLEVLPRTAFDILVVYAQLREDNKEGLVRKLESDRFQFITMAAFCRNLLSPE